jgi:hypothetical protein
MGSHKKICKHVNIDAGELLTVLKEQLAAKDEQIAAKDRQIEAQAEEIKMLIKKPRTVNHNTTNRYVVEQHINVFGKETLKHITSEQIQKLLSDDPENAVAKMIKLKHHREPSNSNVRCPNINKAIYQVVVQQGDEKEWENRAKGDVLEKLYDDNSTILEGEAVEEEHMPFLDHQDRVKASASANAVDGGRCYKQELDKIHNVIIT